MVQLADGGLLISWSPSSRNSTSSAAQYYIVEYRTVGPWVRLSGPVRAGRRGKTNPQFHWTTASRGAAYHFRVLAYSADNVASQPSHDILLHTGGETQRTQHVQQTQKSTQQTQPTRLSKTQNAIDGNVICYVSCVFLRHVRCVAYVARVALDENHALGEKNTLSLAVCFKKYPSVKFLLSP